jgi:hypothetical protein
MNYANHIGYSDINPYEVVRVVSDKTLEVRAMDAKLAEGQKPEIIPGGFVGHCVNQHSLKYDITSNPQNSIIKIRLHKNGYYYYHGSKFQLSDKPVRFYDYNF